MSNKSYQDAIIEDLKEFVATEISPFAAKFDQDEELPMDLINKMGEKGYLAASFPKEYGGLGLDPIYYGIFTEEVGKACNATRSLLTVHTSLVGETLLRWGSVDQKVKWIPQMVRGEKIAAFGLTEPEVGTDARSIQTSYRKEGDKYILNGKKKWITFGDLADIFIIIAQNEGKVTAFIIDRNTRGVVTKRMRGLLAGRASHIAEIEMDDVEVKKENILGIEGGGFSYIVSTALDHGRYSIAWAGVAIAQASLEAMVNYSRNRKQFDKKICKFQLVKGIIGDATTKIHAARALCLKAGSMRKNMDHGSILETSMAKYFTSKIAMDVATDGIQVHGGNGISTDYPVERLFREAKILEIIEGTSQVQQEMIANYALREYFINPPKRNKY
ncbi:MAG: acyl-CoA dehydrogenase [bacterium]|nr:acyl-CoA dehydrogenase [bacterium]